MNQKEMQNLISVIIPIFNLENFLSRTLQSVQEQTYKNLEILLIDDGSIDDSVKICQKFCQEDKRFRLLQKENGGASSARNLGLDECQGDFVLFIDGDDFVKKNHIDDLYQSIKKYNADIGISGHIDVDINHLHNISTKYDELNFNCVYVINPKQAIEQMIDGRPYGWEICAKLYCRNVINNIRFDLNEMYAEDFSFAYQAIHKSNKIVVYTKPSYLYIKHQNSVTSQVNVKKYMPLLKTANCFEVFVKDNYPDLLYCSQYFTMHANITIITAMIDYHLINDQNINDLLNDEKFLDCLAYVRKNFLSLVLNTKIRFRVIFKIKVFLIVFFIRLYYKIRAYRGN